MDSKQLYRLRVETCIGTIIDVHKTAKVPREKESLVTQFELLRKAVTRMDMSQVSEQDVLMVENATNALLGEFRPVFESSSCGPVYRRQAH